MDMWNDTKLQSFLLQAMERSSRAVGLTDHGQTDSQQVAEILIGELQIKTTLRHHLTPPSLAIIKTTKKSVGGCGEIGNITGCC